MAFLKETSVWEDYIESSFITLVCSIDGLVVNCGVDVEVILVAGGRRRWRHIGAEGMCLCTRLPLCLISPCKVNAMQCKLSVCGEILKKCVVVDFQTPSQDLRQLLSFSDDHPRGHFWGQNSQRKKNCFWGSWEALGWPTRTDWHTKHLDIMCLKRLLWPTHRILRTLRSSKKGQFWPKFAPWPLWRS